MNAEHTNKIWDVVVIGGGSAGLSAALTLARARRRVAVIDSGAPRNAPAAAAHGLLGQEGINPLELLATGRQEAAAYGAHLLQDEVVGAAQTDEGFAVDLRSGARIHAGQVLIATGTRDELPAIPGLAERWGRDVVHCPYCHGWEIRDQRIGMIATGEMSAMQALLFHQWTDRLWFFPGDHTFPTDQLDRLAAVGISVVDGEVARVEVADDALTGITMNDGSRYDLDAVAVPSLTAARLKGLEGLGVETVENAAGIAVVADATGHTSVPGVWAAGNVVNPGMQVSEAAANGARVAMTINTELVFARADRAVAASAAGPASGGTPTSAGTPTSGGARTSDGAASSGGSATSGDARTSDDAATSGGSPMSGGSAAR